MQAEDPSRAVTEQGFRLIVNSIPGLVYTMTPACELEFLNQNLLDYFGKSREELKDWDKIGIVHPEDLPAVDASIKRALEWGEPPELPHRLRRHDGIYRWCQPRAHAMRDSEGRILRWYLTLTDIDDFKRAEEALRAREADVQEIVNSIPGFIATFKADGELEFLSQPLVDYHGCTVEEAKNRAPLLHPEDIPRVRESWGRAVASGTPFEDEHRIRRRDGVYRWFQLRGVPRRDGDGRVIRWYMLLTDITDRKTIEDQLRDRESSLLEAQRISQTGSWRHDLVSGQVTVMPEVEKIFAIQPDEGPFTAESFFSRIHAEDRQQEALNYEQALLSKRDFESTYRIVLPDGSIKHIRNIGHPKLNASGEVIAFVGTAMDVTAQWQARANLEQAFEEIRRLTGRLRAENLALRERERELNLIIESIPGMVWCASPNGVITYVNKRVFEYLGLASKELAEDKWGRFVHPDDLGLTVRAWERSVKTGEPFDVPFRVRRSDGVYRWFQPRAFALRDSEGSIVRWYAMLTDIDDLKRAEEALRAREADFREIVDSVPGLVATMTPGGDVEFVSQPILDYTGWTLARLNNWAPLVHPDDLPGVVTSWRHSIERGEAWNSDHRLLRVDGVYRWFQHRGVARRDAEGRVIRWYVLLWDIDDRKRAEAALSDSQVRLSQAAQVATIGELAASIAHEVNQPLAAVVTNGYACVQWLSAQPPMLTQAREAVERVIRDGKEAGEVVRRVRALFKRTAVERTELDIKEVIREVLHLMNSAITKRRAVVQIDLDAALPPVLGDRVQLQQLILNLVLNGLEAMDAVQERPNALVISATPDSSCILIKVRDSGVGLKDAEKIFDPFFTTKQNGMGMGLAICRTIVDAHGGRIWALSDKGLGATLCFTLPYRSGSTSESDCR